MELSPFAENIAIFSINWPNLRKRLIRSEKYWWKLPIRSSQICLCWLIWRWYKNDMLECFWNCLFSIVWLSENYDFAQNSKKRKFTLMRPRKIYLRNLKIPSILLYHLEIYLHEQIWLNPTCKFSKFGQFTWNFDIFLHSGIFHTFPTTYIHPVIPWNSRQLSNKWFHSGKKKHWVKHM